MTVTTPDLRKSIKNKTILITGGTGSFGNAVFKRLLDYDPQCIVILSRDEKKQHDMRNEYSSDKLRFVLGDVRDKETIDNVMYGVDYVFHAAALKHVPVCEFFPMEAIETNAMGSNNVMSAAVNNNIKNVVILSTDKAVYPINVMGMSKALMERIMIAKSRENKGNTNFCGTRYGNVMYTRGSVIPFFIDLMKLKKNLRVTDGNMTRFMMSLDNSVDLVLYALVKGKNGEIYVKKSPAATMGDLVTALTEIFSYNRKVQEIGKRPGEKIHECLISREELTRTYDCGDYYKIIPESPNMNYEDYFRGERTDGLPEEGYTSDNTKQLSVKEIKVLLLSLPEIKKELANFKKGRFYK
ncbi:MAG: UDP-glucose 4-epimerase [Candidatus Yanofskybacteria bacterium CG10_big_fil_rev_8_21_14_0_10_46_23]|uniref:UDP-glucose 4-epimerase n=1 Tax=Candidatus Yanofskybacteria bacterium CG10_big_fil_rev_8_21_14_0_10_46_23 TaxID=1975098 RepID=A0A2H0R555_9BACT|nr:MAG: UDP-glucose 4-epimerase [Candidatus Yanofskybacteria bacterium CG10_big_fil_rev_8_21_14_0_10_46_23]